MQASTQAGGKTNAPAGARNSLLASLTEREREVLRWLIEGKRDAEIGTILGTSVRTIHKHVQRILAKLGVETRTAAARQCLSGHPRL